MSENLTNERKKLAWVGGMILCLLAGGWVVWKVWAGSGPRTGEKFVIEGADNARATAVRRRPTTRPAKLGMWMDGVKQMQENQWQVRSGGVMLLVNKRADKVNYLFVYPNPDVVTPEWREIQGLRAKALQNHTAATALGIKGEQLKKLKAMPSRMGGLAMEVKAEDQEQIKTLWAEYASATTAGKVEVEKKLVKTLGEIGKNSLDGTKQMAEKEIQQIRDVLTPEQWKLVKQMPPAAPTTQKAAATTRKAATTQHSSLF